MAQPVMMGRRGRGRCGRDRENAQRPCSRQRDGGKIRDRRRCAKTPRAARRCRRRCGGAGGAGGRPGSRRRATTLTPGNATDGGSTIGAGASRPQARPDGAGDDLAAQARPSAACGAGMAAAGGAGFGVARTARLVCSAGGGGRMPLPARRPRNMRRCGRRRVGCGLGCLVPAASMAVKQNPVALGSPSRAET